MLLTPAQLQTLKADILVDPAFTGVPNSADGNLLIATAYNTTHVPNFFVYRTNVPTQDIFDQVVWANLTPTDTPDGTQAWANHSLACQGKQFNLQTLLMGQGTINAAKSNIRAGLQDALTNVPAGASGALIAAGWVGVRDNALARLARRIEALFASVGGAQDGTTAAKAATLVVEGTISGQQIQDARNS
jgi:hypothetical protein